ncbi:Small nuclear ribonucleoprotein Sm D3 [Smittium mucronatum]|uniref:Small nuclear ribonucleoprotein Sm D3 n=1 Tax=Smittium mucronatum TaxID=133383 RepID=A0A1R0GW98_9FUNG|nr:Small nuclear ribonucleoprotein Sm D3 [Smittium mucronatum]
MNIQVRNITVTERDGRTSHLEQAYIRGSHARFFIVPDMLKNAPMFKRMDPKFSKTRGIGMNRGRGISRGTGRGRGMAR